MAIITTETEFKNAITAQEPVLEINDNITLTTEITINYPVTIQGMDSHTISWGGSGPVVKMITSTNALSITNLILDGTNTDVTLLNITGGTCHISDTTIQNIRSTTAKKGLIITGENTVVEMINSEVLGVSSDAAVSCSDGTLTLIDTGIHDNMARGLDATNTTINMQGDSRINNNETAAVAGIIAIRANINMGINEGDAPAIISNIATAGYSGGIFLNAASVLTMNFNATIADNGSSTLSGGVGLSEATLIMKGKASITDNTTVNGGGGVFAQNASRVVLNDNATIANNEVDQSAGLGGGIYLQGDSILEVGDTAIIQGNKAYNGAGVYCNSGTTMEMGIMATDTPKIIENTAVNNGGGIFIKESATINLKSESLISNNQAGIHGKGVFNEGNLYISESPMILDGLYFTFVQNTKGTKAPIVTENGNVPIIENALDDAKIHLEESEYIKVDNIPLVLGKVGNSYPELSNTDTVALIPPTPFEGHILYRNNSKDQVLVGLVDAINASFSIVRIE